MNICVLEDESADSASPFAGIDPPADPEHYLPGHVWHRQTLTKANAVSRIVELSKHGYDLFLNLCDGAWDEDRPGIEVVTALERLGLAFTGAASSFYEPSRESMKMVCRYCGVPTPDGTVAATVDEALALATGLRYPLIVKHPNSYSSVGLTRRSRVQTPDELACAASIMISRYGAALIEEFIEGRELTVLVAENADDPGCPFVYRPVEFLFPPGETFKHFDLKWRDYEAMKCVPCGGSPADDELSDRVRDMSRRLFVGLSGSGYGRCDIRVDADGVPYMLEINPNCGVFYPSNQEGSADFILQRDPAGHAGFGAAIFRSAFQRKRENTRSYRVRYVPGSGYGLFAARRFETGDVVLSYEETPHTLVSKPWADARFAGREETWFSQYAYPVSEGVYVSWSKNPEDWRPINHSCDPNAWLTGLDVTARHQIMTGEELTIDYATFCNESMDAFVCRCRTEPCRRIIRGTDYLEDFVAAYGDHISDYVRAARSRVKVRKPS